MSSSEIGGTPRVFRGTQGFRSTPVENHCPTAFKFVFAFPKISFYFVCGVSQKKKKNEKSLQSNKKN